MVYPESTVPISSCGMSDARCVCELDADYEPINSTFLHLLRDSLLDSMELRLQLHVRIAVGSPWCLQLFKDISDLELVDHYPDPDRQILLQVIPTDA